MPANRAPLSLAMIIVEASRAAREEVDPAYLLAAAESVRHLAPTLAKRLETRARRAVLIRSMLHSASAVGPLDEA